MTDLDKRKELENSVQYFEKAINLVLTNINTLDGIEPMELMRHYNHIRNELSTLYVDTDI